jgi:hypothetical protein
VEAVLRVFLSRRWLGWHLLLVAGLTVLILLGRWQWVRAQSQVGTLQNLGYAFEWWLFAGLAVYGWWREMWADARAAARGEPMERTLGPTAVTAGLGRSAAPGASSRELALGGGDGGAHVAEDQAEDEVDHEVAAYNEYLARLNARYNRQRH